MTMESQTREMPALELRAAFEPSTLDREKRTVDLVWTTGARVLRGFWDPYYEELSLDAKHVRMDRLSNGKAPFLMDHDNRLRAVAGVVESATLNKTEGRARIRFLKAGVDPEVDKYFERVADGVAPNVSVGYRVYKMEKVEEAEGKVPVMRATDWQPHEVSGVAIGADAGASMRSVEADQRNPCEFITRGSVPQKEIKMPEEQQTRTEPATPPTPPVDVEKVRAEERQRVTEITALVRKASLDGKLADDMIARGVSMDAARAEVLDAVFKRSAEGGPSEAPSGSGITVGREEKDTQRTQASSWLIEKTGLRSLVEQAKDKPVFARAFKDGALVDPGAARGMSLRDMARDFLERNGVKTRGMTPFEMAGRALNFHRSGPYQGTDSFPVLFEDALRKVLLAAYATQSDTWRLFCDVDTVPDFRPAPRYRTGEMGGTLDLVNENGEYKNKQIPDGARTDISTETRGSIIALTREAIINDDMGALANVAANFGRLAGRTIEVSVYNLLALNGGLGPTMSDGNPFFHSSRGNVGTGSALGVAGLQADRVLMRKQKDLNGADFIDLRLRTLLLPVELEADANLYNDAQYDPSDNKFQKPNVARGLFTTIVGSPRLSGTRRYMFADPAGGASAIKVVFLEGSGEGPTMEMQEGFRVDGTMWKVRIDMKVNPFDPKGAITNAGA